MLTTSELFNCCTGHQPPDWEQYAGLELAGCRDADKSPGNTMALRSYDDLQFYTVYGRRADGRVEAITDIPLDDDDAGFAIQVAATLGAMSKLPVTIHPSLSGL